MQVSLQLDKWIRLDVVKTLTIRTSHQALVTVCVCNSPCLLRPVSRQQDTTLRQRDQHNSLLLIFGKIWNQHTQHTRDSETLTHRLLSRILLLGEQGTRTWREKNPILFFRPARDSNPGSPNANRVLWSLSYGVCVRVCVWASRPVHHLYFPGNGWVCWCSLHGTESAFLSIVPPFIRHLKINKDNENKRRNI